MAKDVWLPDYVSPPSPEVVQYHRAMFGVVAEVGTRLIVHSRDPKAKLFPVWEVMQVDREANEILIEPMNHTVKNHTKRIGEAMWVKADDPRFIFWKEV